MLLEAGISAVAGVIVFVVSLALVDGVRAPLAPLIAFGVVVAVLVHPRVFRPLAARILHRLGYGRELPEPRGETLALLLLFYSGTWILGGLALWLLLRSVGAHPDLESIVFLGGVGCGRRDRRGALRVRPVGARAARGVDVRTDARGRERGAGPGATALNRVAITLVEVLLLLVGGLLLRGAGEVDDAEPPAPRRRSMTS